MEPAGIGLIALAMLVGLGLLLELTATLAIVAIQVVWILTD